jgi:15-cis-phytoene synthase
MNTLTAAFEECRVLNNHYGTRFHAALNKLPNHLQPHVHGLCAFDRILIEMIRNPKPGVTTKDQVNAMLAWQQAFEAGMADELPTNIYLQAAVHSAKVLDLNENLYTNLVASRVKEHTTKKYATFASLSKQIKATTKPISVLLSNLLSLEDAKSQKAIQQLAEAGELIELLHDLPKSLKRGVNYLSVADMKKYRCSEKTLREEKVTNGCKKLLESYLNKACKDITSANKILCHPLSKHTEFFSTIADSYLNLIQQIRENDYELFSLQPKVSWKLKLRQSFPAFSKLLS